MNLLKNKIKLWQRERRSRSMKNIWSWSNFCRNHLNTSATDTEESLKIKTYFWRSSFPNRNRSFRCCRLSIFIKVRVKMCRRWGLTYGKRRIWTITMTITLRPQGWTTIMMEQGTNCGSYPRDRPPSRCLWILLIERISIPFLATENIWILSILNEKIIK